METDNKSFKTSGWAAIPPKRIAVRNLLKVANSLVSVGLGRGLGNIKITTALMAGKPNWLSAQLFSRFRQD